MSSQLLKNTSYDGLLRAVKAALSAGLIDARKALEYQRVKTYWTIGTEIRQRVDASRGALTYQDQLYQRISADVERLLGVDLSKDAICRSIQFSKAYSVFPDKTPLTFTHYLALMRVRDIKKRLRLEKQAINEGLSVVELKERVLKINSLPVGITHKSTKALKVERGEPYVYIVRPFEDLTGKANMCVDCGFKIHVPIKGSIIKHAPSFSTTKSRHVRVIKTGNDYDVRLAVRKRGLIYTYSARVLRVVDGDTLDALIDVGFGIRVEERFRLKAIDAPEIKTKAGQKAKAFLTEYLSKCPIIAVRTSKAGMYGRWLGDIFAMPGQNDPRTIAAEGEYLNQVLINQGFAVNY